MFTKDSRTENFLNQIGVSFRYTNALTLSDLSTGWAERNLARPVPVRDEAVMEYATLMESGSAAPAPILAKTESGYDILDGVQRVSAAMLSGFTKLSAYVVESDSDETLTAIRVLANARLQGRAEPLEWTRRRAVEVLVGQKGMSIAEVAKLGGWRQPDIAKIAKALDWGFKIRCIGGPDLPDVMIETIAKHTTQEVITKAPEVMAEFFNALKQSQFSAADAEPFVEEFFRPVAGKIHNAYVARLEDFKNEPEVATRLLGRKSASMPLDVSLLRIFKSASTVLDEIAAGGEPLTNVDEFFRWLNSIKEKLHAVAKKHKKPIKTPTPGDMWCFDERT